MSWDFNKIPAEERPQIRIDFDAGDFDSIIESIEKYKVAAGCISCGHRKDVHQWMDYIFKFHEDWTNGAEIEL